MRTLVWIRGKDLRVADHAPLASKGEVIPVFVLDPYFFAPERAQTIPNRIQFLLESLAELAEAIAALGSRLIVVEGKSVDVIPELAKKFAVDRVAAYRWTEPIGKERDRRVANALEVPFDLHEGETLATPGLVLTGAGKPFAVFTPYSRAFMKAVTVGSPHRAPRELPPLPKLPKVREVPIPTAKDLGITPNEKITPGGESAARERLAKFVRGPAAHYETGRNMMGEAGTSRLSQDLKFGTLSARTVWSRIDDALADHPKARRIYLNELVWREFAYDILGQNPRVLTEPYREKWKKFPWRKDEAGWKAWVTGTTGYPVVDAAARQLLEEGFVHNRARMIAASFLAKHLLIDFRRGEAHYLKYLTDGDWASNDLGWQWSTGCGVDAQPWFRVFNPELQAKRFDPDGAYVRRYVPELRTSRYPKPIVDHAFARKRFLSVAHGHVGTSVAR